MKCVNCNSRFMCQYTYFGVTKLACGACGYYEEVSK